MSGIVKGVKKIFKKIKESNILKVAVAAAAIWFTAGTAMNYFGAASGAAGTAGSLGASMSAQASSMWGSVTNAFTSEAVANGNAAAAAEGEALMSGAVATPVNFAGTEAGIPQLLSDPVVGSAISGVAPASDAMMSSVADGSMMDLSSLAPETGSVAGFGTGDAGFSISNAMKGAGSWMKENPMSTMMLGQAGAGAYGGYLADKESERLDDERKDRGLFGFDSEGNYGGVVNSQRTASRPQTNLQPTTRPPVARDATARPQVRPQTPGAPGSQTASYQVPRNQLPSLQEQGQLYRKV
ncbi:MAG: hypothetical protein JRC99_11485 [Deltaproteobacteria bacterium]|nr:hypothetical protein [Deltaproteobacteria bacterium]